jgi:hypothetical protein
MNNLNYKALILAILAIGSAYAGNPDRQGQAGAQQLVINGWGRSSAWGWTNVAGVKGIEASYLNVAGLAKSNMTEVAFSRTNWLSGSGLHINNFGLAQQLGGGNALGVSVQQWSVAPITITTEDQPYGGLGTYRVSMSNIGLGYGRKFNDAISGGIMFRAVSEGIPDARAMGVSLDAGVQYTNTSNPASTVKKDDIHFGIVIKNIGPNMRHTGDGLSTKAIVTGADYTRTVEHRVDGFQLPTVMAMSAAYDFRLDASPESYYHRLTVGMGFANHAFQANETSLGLEYAYNNFVSGRLGFVYQEGIFNYDTRVTAYTGFCGGLSLDIPFKTGNNEKSNLGIDYSYRATSPFGGTHTFGIRIDLNYDAN